MKLFRIAGGAGLLASTLLLAPAASAAIALTGATYTENFDTLAASGTTGTALPDGWQFVETGANANSSYAVGTGSSNAGDTYSFGSAGSSDRALGTLGSGNLSSMFGAIFQNVTGATITAFTLDYFGEQWRNGSASADSLQFQYLVGATSISAGTWTDFSALDFDSVVGGGLATLNGNLAANRAAIGATVSGLSIANNATFGIRWIDVDVSGAEDGLAVDDLSLSTITAQSAVPEPATWAMFIGGFGLVGGALRRRRSTGVRFA